MANSRLAMLGVFAAVAAELGSGMNVFQQVQTAPVPIALTFLALFVATAVPVLRGVPRRSNGFWSADAEIVNGRLVPLSALSWGHVVLVALCPMVIVIAKQVQVNLATRIIRSKLNLCPAGLP